MLPAPRLLLFAALTVGCSSSRSDEQTLLFGAYTTPREAYAEILPAFAEDWRERTGHTLRFEESYQASGAQTRAVLGGFEADVVALSLAPDVQRLADAGMISHDWQDGERRGMVTESLVVLAVREGNPKNIRDWADLARPDVEVLTPNVRTSGGAMWNVAAVWGAAMRGRAGVPAGDEAAAVELIGRILARVKGMDKGARESLLTFEKGVGDVAITYENEVLGARLAGKAIDYVVPPSTLRIENPVAVVDAWTSAHGTADAARGLVAWLHGPEAQQAYARHGLRPVDPAFLPASLPTPEDLFSVRDLGGWDAVQRAVFADGGAYDRALARSRAAP